MISGLLKLLLGLLPKAGEAAVGLFRFRNEFLLFSEPDLVVLMMMTVMMLLMTTMPMMLVSMMLVSMMLVSMMMATMIIVSSS